MSDSTRRRDGSSWRRGTVSAALGSALVFAIAVALPAAAGGQATTAAASKALWSGFGGKPAARSLSGAPVAIAAKRVRSFRLDQAGLTNLLARAPRERTRAARRAPLVVSLPAPRGGFQRFELVRSRIMAPGLAAKHPDIKTYKGVGIDDPTASLHADVSRLGFHASVRSAGGTWYIDPYYRLDRSVYVAYFGRDMPPDPAGPFVERDAGSAELSVDKGYYHAADDVTVTGSGFDADAVVTLTISDPEGDAPDRAVAASADDAGGFTATFPADPDGKLGTRIVATDGGTATSYQVVRDDDPTVDPPTGDVLRTYRLALVTDPGYAAFHGGSANVTAAKVALMNRVSQVYEEDLSIRLQLIANNDLLNLDTWGEAIGPNGPCGAAACYTQAQVTGCSNLARNRTVIGQIVGARNYDIGHLALGQPGGGVANLGVIGRSAKAQGCTGIQTPTGDYYAIDYVAHEMGHQFSGNHPFNGNQLNCSGGNRSGATSVEPGSGSSIMAYAGICMTDDLQPHSDPYFSQRSLQEISTYTSSDQLPINEVQGVALRHFGGGNEVQQVTFGPGYSQSATIQPLSVPVGGAPGTTQLGGLSETGNTVTVSTGAAGPVHTLQPGDVVTISGAPVADYNGTWTVDTVPTTRAFTYTNPVSGLPRSGGGTVTLAAPGLSESGDTVTVRTAAAHNRSVGDIVVVSGAPVAGYNGTWVVTSVPTPRSFTYTNPTVGLATSGGGSATYSSPFQVRIGGGDSAVIGGSSQPYTATNVQNAINAIPGFAGTATVTGLAATGFTITYSGASANSDIPSAEIVNLSCGGCFSSVEETNHGGALDSFRIRFGSEVSAPIAAGPGFSLQALQTAIQGESEVQTVSLAGYDTNGDSYRLRYEGADSVPITRGQNNTQAGIQAALQGGNEQQQVTLTGFNPASANNNFQVEIGGNTSAVLGNGGTTISNANLASAINAIPGFAGTVTVANAGVTGFTVTFGGASAGTDVPSISIVNLGCAPGCTAAVRETVKGTGPVAGWPAGGTVAVGTVTDAGYTLTFSGAHQGTDVSQVALADESGVTGTTAETVKGAPGILPVGATATVTGFGGGTLANTGFQVTFGSNLGLQDVPMLGLEGFTAGAEGFVNDVDKGGPVDNKGGSVTPTGNAFPSVSTPAQYTIPLRTPFALTGSATDADGDAMTFAWEQNDQGGSAGTSLLSNTKTNGPLFAMFPKSGVISESDALLYNSPGENHLTASPTRVFPDLQQILDNNTNADTGACPLGPIAPPVPIPVKECFAEFLPTSDYAGAPGVNSSPLSLHFRFTARDGKGGVNAADTTLLLATGAGPFRVTSQAGGSVDAGSTQTVTWDVANTDVAPVGTTDVKISLSVDGGQTYPHVLAASTPNDGSADVAIPDAPTEDARIKVEAIGNVFFDVSNADLTIEDSAPPVLTVPGPIVKNATMPSGRVVTYTVSATDDVDESPDVVCTPPSGSVFPIGTTTVSCEATDEGGNSATASFTIRVKGAAEQLADLRALVTGLGAGKSLANKVKAAEEYVAAGREGAACTILENGFPNEVDAQRGKTITAAEARRLKKDAARIANVLDC